MAHGAFDKARLRKEIEADHKAKARAKIAHLKARIHEAQGARKVAMALLKERCRLLRIAVRDKIKGIRQRARERLKQIAQRLRAQARAECDALKAEARKNLSSKVALARAELRAERRYQAQLKRIERQASARERAHPHATYLQRRGESDDQVRQNIPQELIPLFEQIKWTIKGTRLRSRTEAFLHYVHEHPDAALEANEHEAIKQLRKLERQHAEEVRASRRRPSLSEVPF